MTQEQAHAKAVIVTGAHHQEERRQRWVEESHAAFRAYDAYVEKHGVYGAAKRLF